MIVTAGSTNKSVYFYIVGDASHASPGDPITGLLFSDIETGGSASYMRQGAARVDLTLITLASASATHADGGFIEVDATNMPGVYRCDYPDAAWVTGVDQVICDLVVAAANNAAVAPVLIDITDFNLREPTSAANFVSQYDGTGITDDTFPATQAQLGSISTGSAAISIEAESYTLTTGTQSSGTITDTETLNQVYHEHTDTAGVLDLYYQFDVGGNGIAVDVNVAARINGSNDTILIQAYNWGGASWDQVGKLVGTNGTADTVEPFELLRRNTGTGANLGIVRVRFYAASGLTSATLRVDRISAAFSIVTESVGYALGRIWLDTNGGTDGSTPFFNGVADKKCLTWANVKALISGGLQITDVHLINGSSLVLDSTVDNYSFFGDNWTLDMGSQSTAGAYFQGATVSGTGTAVSEVHFEGCDILTSSLQLVHADYCGFSGTVTHTLAGDYNYHNCYSKVAGAGSPTFTKTPGQAITLQFRNWAGGITLSGLEAGDAVTVGGTLGTVTLNGADATVEIRGTYKAIVNNLTGSPSVNSDGALQVDDIVDKTWDEVISKAAHDVGQSAAKVLRQGGDLVQIDGAVSDVTPSTTNFDTDLTQADGYFDDAVMIFSNGSANSGIGRPISSYLNASGNVTFLSPDDWPVTPVNGDDFVIYATHVHPIAQIQSGLATEAKQDIIDANVDAILVDTGASGVVLASSEHDAIAAAFLAYNMGDSRTVEQALHWLRNKWTIIDDVLTVYDTDDTTVSWTAAITKTAGNPVSASDPV